MRLRVLFVLSLVSALGVGVTGQVTLAQGSLDFFASGQVTKAIVSSDSLSGSFAGTVEGQHECLDWHYDMEDPDLEALPHTSEYCSWTPFASVGPGVDAADCSDPSRDDPENPGPGVTVIWVGSEHRGAGVDGFELDDVPLEGANQPLLCILALVDWYIPEQCWVSRSTGVVSCLFEEDLFRVTEPITSAQVMEAETESPGDPPGSQAPADLGAQSATSPPAAKVDAKKQKRNKAKRKRRAITGAGGVRLYGNSVVSKR